MILTFQRALDIVKGFRKEILILLIVAQFLAILEILTLISIYPVLNFILVENNNVSLTLHFKILTIIFPEESYQSISVVIAFIMVVCSSSFRIFLIMKTNFTVADLRQKITKKIFSAYLSKNYNFYLQNHRSEMVKNILSEVDLFVVGYLLPLLAIITNFTVVLYIFVFLTLLSAEITLLTLSFFLISYSIIFLLVRIILVDAGNLKVTANKKRFIIVNNAIGSIRDVILGGSQQLYQNEFFEPNKTYANMTARVQTIAQSPRYLIEGLMLCAILFVLSLSLSVEQDTYPYLDLAILATFTLAALKLLPSIQLVYHSFAQARSSDASVLSLYKVINSLSGNVRNADTSVKLTFKSRLDLENISFSYPGSSDLVLDKLSVSIGVGERIGLVGQSGSGKSTLCDLILGLLEPSSGTISVDGKVIDRSNIQGWQNIVGYVPQEVFLIDDSVYRNVAGITSLSEEQEMKVRKACSIAAASEFIEKLPAGYDTRLGDNAVLLSGGQKQRLGIAKVMYRDVSLIVLDEATSALDANTEERVLETLDRLPDHVAQIIISHNIETLRNCDRIYELTGGVFREKRVDR